MAPVIDKFDKILVSKRSESNGCLSPDGALLGVDLPKKAIQRGSWHFVDKFGTRNRFGWVERRDSFSFEEFVFLFDSQHVNLSSCLDFSVVQRQMLMSISKLDVGAPVSADFLLRGIPPEPVLVIHKVIFYGGSD